VQSRQNPVVLGVTLAKVNDRLAVWRPVIRVILDRGEQALAKVNDRLAVWRHIFLHTGHLLVELAKVNDRLAVWN